MGGSAGITDKKLLLARLLVLGAARVKENCFSLSLIAVPSCQTWGGRQQANFAEFLV
jgi:hypothetical protein